MMPEAGVTGTIIYSGRGLIKAINAVDAPE